jgi:hypothetical protein
MPISGSRKYSQVALSNVFWYRTGALIFIITAGKRSWQKNGRQD